MNLIIVFFSLLVIFFFKQKTAYEMRISDWSSDVCSSDLRDDAERDILRIFGGRFDDMRVGQDARRGERDAAAVAEADEIGRARVGKECVSTCRSRWSPYHLQKNRISSELLNVITYRKT